MAKPDKPPGKPDKPPPEAILPPEPPESTGAVSVELPMAKATAYQGELAASISGGGGGSATLVSSYAGYVDGSPTPTYYVDATGGSDGNAGTSSGAAWQTLNALWRAFSPGDVIALKRGETWNEMLKIDGVTGGSGNPVIYTAYGAGALPIIDGGNSRTFCVQVNNDVSHVVISNLHLKRATYDGLQLNGGALEVYIYNVYSELNGRDGFDAEAYPGTNDQSGVEYINCTADRNGRAGFVTYNIAGAGSGVSHYNCKATYSGQAQANHGFSAYYATNVNWYGCEAAFTNIDPDTGDPNAFTSEGFGFCYDDFSGGGTCRYNYSHDNQGPGFGAGHQANGNTLEYNLAALNLGPGCVMNGDAGGSDNTKIYSNTFVSNTLEGLSVFSTGASTGLEVKNNILANNGTYGMSLSGSVTSYTVATNIIYGNGSGATTGVSGATGTITTDPTLDGSYVPSVGSPAINAGLTLTNDMGLHSSSSWPLLPAVTAQSGTWEIGAFVYG